MNLIFLKKKGDSYENFCIDTNIIVLEQWGQTQQGNVSVVWHQTEWKAKTILALWHYVLSLVFPGRRLYRRIPFLLVLSGFGNLFWHVASWRNLHLLLRARSSIHSHRETKTAFIDPSKRGEQRWFLTMQGNRLGLDSTVISHGWNHKTIRWYF